MPEEPSPADDAMEEGSALPTAIIDRLATLDDRLAGHSSRTTDAVSPGSHASTADEGVDGLA